jgi:hypothetical protein
MTAMTTNTREFDIDTLVLTAYQYAGLVNEMQTAQGPQWDARSAYGRKQLEVIVDQLGAEGIYERSVEWYDLRVAAGDRYTPLPSDTLDVRGVAKLVQGDVNETLLDLEPMTRDRYNELPTVTASGTPGRFYVSRGVPMNLYLWPVPDVACTIRVQRQRLSYDNSRGAASVDLERFWTDYLLNELASRLALGAGLSVERAAMYAAKAISAKNAAKGKSSGQLPNQIEVDHRGPYRGRW